MEQRRLRLGDILDDYCPRERRVTNHAVVAMIEDEVKQTRCTTCDAEHVYKAARVPKRRKKETPAALYKEVLAGMPESDPETDSAVSASTPDNMSDTPDTPPTIVEVAPRTIEPEPETTIDDLNAPPAVDDGPVHRQLLRAKLPRPEGQKDARPLPEFTVRQSGGRSNGGQFRGGGQRPRGGDPRSMMGRGNGGTANGNRPQQGGGGGRFQGSRPGQHRNQGGRGGSQNPFRGGQPRHGGKKGRG
jgi:hypothetical protein